MSHKNYLSTTWYAPCIEIRPSPIQGRRNIAVGEELTQDYALYTANLDWVLTPCHCGSSLCRHVVTGNDWQRRDVQERYKGHFSPFLNERITYL